MGLKIVPDPIGHIGGGCGFSMMGGVVAFNPSSIAWLLRLDADQIVLANDALVETWPDISGNANDATAAGADRPTFKTAGLNGKPAVLFATNKLATPSFLTAALNTAMTCFVVNSSTSVNLQVSTSHNGARLYLGEEASSDTNNISTSALTPAIFKGRKQVVASGAHQAVIGYSYNGSISTIICNRFVTQTAATGNLGLSGALTIGNLSSGGYAWAGQIAAVYVSAVALSVDQMRSVSDWLIAHYALSFNPCTLIAYDGNSMTAGVGATVSYPSVCLSTLGQVNFVHHNVGVSGKTTPQLITDAATKVEPLRSNNSYLSKKICVIWEGTNDLCTGATAATAYANLVTYCQARQATGWKVVIATILPRSNAGTPGSFEADRQTVNAGLIANWATFADALADVAADARIGEAGDSDNATYYADKVHLTNAGYAIVAGIVKAAIDTLA